MPNKGRDGRNKKLIASGKYDIMEIIVKLCKYLTIIDKKGLVYEKICYLCIALAIAERKEVAIANAFPKQE